MPRLDSLHGCVEIPALPDSDKGPPRCGLDNLPRLLELVRARRAGLILNHTAVTAAGTHMLDALSALGADVRVIFTPEHGLFGTDEAGARVTDGTHRGIKVVSLFGAKRAPAPADLAGLDLLVFDIQDVACRFYTYISTMAMAMEKAAAAGLPFLILDRPCLAGGTEVAGPVLRPEFKSFVGYLPLPIAYGMTAGELGAMAVAEGWLGGGHALTVVRLAGWRRGAPARTAGVLAPPPSPNLPTLDAVIAYSGMCLLEATNISEGRGLDTPFLTIGAPWIDGKALAADLAARNLPGAAFSPAVFTPRPIPGKALAPKHSGLRCEGITLAIADRARFQGVRTGLEVLSAIFARWPQRIAVDQRGFARLAGVGDLATRLERGEAATAILASYESELAAFRARRSKYLLYPGP
ncbi:MAG TPA: DUF1343 domain-containing protein [Planctomycetota bacterium]|jgi:uncharacterized protein YbbC (DUF1343 family)|nr:DUF1343 domain-containing protein [Planctomycetota bacterium]OQC22378.1 MAG: hypothetical protein BWX69_00230 [Planctomycetes bacterium ADurb.Bin069]HNR98842.1 DUF1343 domain-containing protein [Planctomycetota bacterium]HNU26673.1 DUF1343 domain-containing protein [Planctomycetota bacterium]HOE29172.1 DUF1343 domain-containing protein [Planctomycetota bacterium]